MKKLLALLLTLIFALSLLACKDPEPETPDEPTVDPDSGLIIPGETDDDGGIDLPIIPA